ncbi:MAG: hypothetical protein ACOYOA_11595 [Saprospiraceae bacterium]
MKTTDLLQEIKLLPLAERFYIVEETIKSIKNGEIGSQMEWAANELRGEYVNNKELTEFTDLNLAFNAKLKTK